MVNTSASVGWRRNTAASFATVDALRGVRRSRGRLSPRMIESAARISVERSRHAFCHALTLPLRSAVTKSSGACAALPQSREAGRILSAWASASRVVVARARPPSPQPSPACGRGGIAPNPHNHTTLIGGDPRSSRAAFTGCANSSICNSFIHRSTRRASFPRGRLGRSGSPISQSGRSVSTLISVAQRTNQVFASTKTSRTPSTARCASAAAHNARDSFSLSAINAGSMGARSVRPNAACSGVATAYWFASTLAGESIAASV